MSQGVTINDVCIDFINFLLPKDSTILELGSGLGSTVALGQNYKLYSVEINQNGVINLKTIQLI